MYLDISKKYKKYINSKNIFHNYFLLPNKEYNYKHDHNYFLLAEVVGGIDFYNLDKVKKIIGTLKNISKCDHKTLINDWIMTLFDIIVDHYLF